MFKIFNVVRFKNSDETNNYNAEINKNILDKITSLLAEVETKVLFDTRSDCFTIINEGFNIDVLINQTTSTITLLYADSVENSVHDKFTIDTIKVMCDNFNHTEFKKQLTSINTRRLVNLKEKEFIKPLETVTA